MQILSDIELERNRIELAIKKFGYTPDHNFDWLKNCSDEGEPGVFIWENNNAIWFYKDDKKTWTIISDPIAPIEAQGKILEEVSEYILDQDENIYFLDVRDRVFNFIKEKYPEKFKLDYEIIWPVVDMTNWDPELPGGHFKELRNAIHKFHREHESRVLPTSELDKKDLHDIVNRWFFNRDKVGIVVLPGRYHDMIDNNFGGTKSSRVMLVDGKPVGFNAGWETPNNSSEWSASIGIHDYSVHDLGVALMYEDLVWIKNAGYKTCDLEGSDASALHFKTQFFDSFTTYKTYTFYVNK